MEKLDIEQVEDLSGYQKEILHLDQPVRPEEPRDFIKPEPQFVIFVNETDQSSLGQLLRQWNSFNFDNKNKNSDIIERLTEFVYSDNCPSGNQRKITNQQAKRINDLKKKMGNNDFIVEAVFRKTYDADSTVDLLNALSSYLGFGGE